MAHYGQPTRRSNGNVVVPAHVAHLQSAAMEGGMYGPYLNGSDAYNIAPSAMMVDDYGNGGAYMQAHHDPHAMFMPLPQAPRLPVAAARASALSAMYYDPTMHAQMLNNAGLNDPWAQQPTHGAHPAPAFDGLHSYGEAPGLPDSMDGRRTEQITQGQHPYPLHQTQGAGFNARSRSLADPYVARQHQGAFGTYGRGSVPTPGYPHGAHEQSNNAWSSAQWSGANQYTVPPQAPVTYRQSYAGPATTYDHPDYRHVPVHRPSHIPPTVGHSNAGWQYRFNADMRRNWEAQQGAHGDPHQAQALYNAPPLDTRVQMGHEGVQPSWQWNTGGQTHEPSWQARDAVHVETAQKHAFWQSQQQRNDTSQLVHDHQQNMLPDRVGHATVNEKGAVAEPIPQQKDAGPAPPSPGTLDKSAVPVSAVGAEIVWIAAAALLDPTLWLPTKEETRTHSYRKRMASHGSSSDVSASTLHTPVTSPINGFQEDWHRQPSCQRRYVGELLEESSASSSEPGTPPSTLPSRIWEQHQGEGHDSKRISLTALHGMRSLGLSNAEDAVHSRMSVDRGSASPNEVQSPRSRSFRRLESFDKSRETVTSVADLLSWECRWSANDDKLDSLRHYRANGGHVARQNDHLAVAPAMSRRTSSQNRMCREDPNSTVSTGLAMSTTEPSPAFRRFTHQVLAQTLVSPTAFMLGIMYALRVLRLAIVVDQNGEASVDPEAVQIFAQPPSAAPFKLFTLGMMIANKHLDDNTFLNKTWNEVTGIALPEINRAERWFLERCSYEITVPETTWVAFLRRLHDRTERRVNMLNGAKRHRVPTVKQAPDAPRRHDHYVPPHAGSEEAQKRFLLCIEEALHNLGYAPTFSLSRTASPLPSPDQTRPKKSLTHMHQHCHSAPAIGLENDVDIFDDEDGPYRPYRRSASRSAKEDDMSISSRNSIATEGVLNRSISDTVPLIAAGHGQNRSCKGDAIQLGDGSAPLAPSVLLELLNKGQHLAHVAS